ncbi:MAG: CRISPR-associated endoribonuclease Cas6 [Breznakibacter sp.]
MRFKITLTPTGRYRMLPIDYQYYTSAWIYKVMARADAGFAEFLHQQGYRNGYKQFKHFCFSPLDIGRPTLWKERGLLEMHAGHAHLHVSFCFGDAAERFVYGIFRDQLFYLGDRFNGMDLQVAHIERMPDNIYNQTVHYRALSPIVASIRAHDSKHAFYMGPLDEGYTDVLHHNLLDKAASMPVPPILPLHGGFELGNVTAPKSKLVTIKPYTPQQSKVRGYTFGFTLTAPAGTHRLIADSGLGEKNAMGFGWCETV